MRWRGFVISTKSDRETKFRTLAHWFAGNDRIRLRKTAFVALRWTLLTGAALAVLIMASARMAWHSPIY
jgi:hypothetical protein